MFFVYWIWINIDKLIYQLFYIMKMNSEIRLVDQSSQQDVDVDEFSIEQP